MINVCLLNLNCGAFILIDVVIIVTTAIELLLGLIRNFGIM